MWKNQQITGTYHCGELGHFLKKVYKSFFFFFCILPLFPQNVAIYAAYYRKLLINNLFPQEHTLIKNKIISYSEWINVLYYKRDLQLLSLTSMKNSLKIDLFKLNNKDTRKRMVTFDFKHVFLPLEVSQKIKMQTNLRNFGRSNRCCQMQKEEGCLNKS